MQAFTAGGGAGLKRGCGSDQGRRRRSSDLYQRGYEYFSVSGAFRSDKASKLIGTLEHKEMLQEFVSEVNTENGGDAGIQVYIGDETPVQSMKDCSVVTANYDLGGGLRGTVGIIGPKRMDYEKVLGTLRNLMSQLDAAFKKDER